MTATDGSGQVWQDPAQWHERQPSGVCGRDQGWPAADLQFERLLTAASAGGYKATPAAERSQTIQARFKGRILVGRGGYNGDFLTLAATMVQGVLALDFCALRWGMILLTNGRQHSLAAALNAYSLGRDQPQHRDAVRITTTLVDSSLRNEPYEFAAGEASADAATKFGTGFGFGGADILQGSAWANDFL